MRFNPKARLDPSQVRVRRGGGRRGGAGGFGTGGGGLPIPIGGRVGGGIGGVILLVVVVVLFQLLGGGGSSSSAGGVDTSGVDGVPNCHSGDDANKNQQCRLVADVNSIQSFWASELPKQSSKQYKDTGAVFFSGSTDTGCGGATTDVGPFYCPVDKTVYLDTSFFHDMLQGQLGAKGGPFSEAYVLAHEYGHHVQDLLGTMSRVRTQHGATSDSVRLELQADCYAGIWAKHATTVPDSTGQPYILDLTRDDYARAIDAAKAVGDDRIEKESGGQVNPDSWTHGSAAARTYWFETGLHQGTLQACDTFSAGDLHE